MKRFSRVALMFITSVRSFVFFSFTTLSHSGQICLMSSVL